MDTFSRETSLDPWYVTGLLESSGTFTYSRSAGGHYSLYFGIKLPDRDLGLLDDIQSFLGGIGRIYSVGSDSSGTARGAAARYYRICRIEELDMVIRHLEKYPLRSSKAQSFSIWREMVEARREFRRPARVQLEALAARLSNLTARGRGRL